MKTNPKFQNLEHKPDPNPSYVPVQPRAEFITVDGKRVASCGIDGGNYANILRDMAKWGRK